MSENNNQIDNTQMPSIREYFRDKIILFTGATGFVGKVLLEKLIRMCPEVGCVYTVVRPKKGVSANDRVSKVIRTKLFEGIRSSYPGLLEQKFIGLPGDLTQAGLGLSDDHYNMILSQVTIIIHSAASIRFDDPLKFAIEVNVKATVRLLEMATTLKNPLEVFSYVSTGYSNYEKNHIDEIVYEPPIGWKTMLKILDQVDETTINLLTPKLISPHKTTYTFSKALSEKAVSDFGDRIPVVICRPTVVMATLKDPFPGWVDTIMGVTGMGLGVCKGLIPILNVADVHANVVPVDVSSHITLAATWGRALAPKYNKEELSVVNCASSDTRKWAQHSKWFLESLSISPTVDGIWYPTCQIITHQAYFTLMFYIKCLLPSIFIDAALSFTNIKLRLWKIYIKIYLAMSTLSLFTTKEWTFSMDNRDKLAKWIHPSEVDCLCIDDENKDWPSYILDSVIGGQAFTLHQTPEESARAKVQIKRWYVIHHTVRFLWLFLLMWLCYDGLLSAKYQRVVISFALLCFNLS